MKRFLCLLACGSLALGPSTAVAQRSAPTASELAAAGSRSRLQGRPVRVRAGVRFTAAALLDSADRTPRRGILLGVLQIDPPASASTLPPGTYQLYLARTGGQRRVYAVAGGRIVQEAPVGSSGSFAFGQGARAQIVSNYTSSSSDYGYRDVRLCFTCPDR